MKSNNIRWSWWMTLLWAYTTLIAILFGVIMVAFPTWTSSAPPASAVETVIIGVTIFFPQIIFLIILGIKNFKNDSSS